MDDDELIISLQERRGEKKDEEKNEKNYTHEGVYKVYAWCTNTRYLALR